MKLIDADEFIANLKDYIDKPMTAELCATLVELAPTAYDIDKVVEELEIERKTANNTYNSFNMDVDLGRVFGLEKAIEIVRNGSVGKDVD